MLLHAFAVVAVVLVTSTQGYCQILPPRNTTYGLNEVERGREFLGIGVNPSAGTTRLLWDYDDVVRDKILDYLFLPNFGASFPRIKVEIGGGGQGTDGSNPSFMNSPRQEDFERGHMWRLIGEAKKRNPSIEVYGLAESFPGWIGGRVHHDNPFAHTDRIVDYIFEWVRGAKTEHGVMIDYIGCWNEHYVPEEVEYIKRLRQRLDESGFTSTRIIAHDSFDISPIIDAMLEDSLVLVAVGALGSHRQLCTPSGANCQLRGVVVDPSTLPAFDARLKGVPVFISEDGSDVPDGASGLLRVREINREYLGSGSQGSNYWNPVCAYYPQLPFWDNSLMDAYHPWSSFYRVRSPLWTSAHVNQLVPRGWSFLRGQASGDLANGCGSVVTYVSPANDQITLVIEKDNLRTAVNGQQMCNGSLCLCGNETATFRLESTQLRLHVRSLAVWITEMNAWGEPLREFEKQPELVHVDEAGHFRVHIGVNTVMTITSLTTTGHKGAHETPPGPALAAFPLPFFASFDGVPDGTVAKYFSDMSGTFAVQNGTLQQQTPSRPTGWYTDKGDHVPYTIVGAADWASYSVSADVHMDCGTDQPWIGARVGGFAECDYRSPICSTPFGVFAVLNPQEKTLSLYSRMSLMGNATGVLKGSTVMLPKASQEAPWISIELQVVGEHVTVAVDGETLLQRYSLPLSARFFVPRAGWAAVGGGVKWSTEVRFDNVKIAALPDTERVSLCRPMVERSMRVVGVPCGLDVAGLAWKLVAAPESGPHATALRLPELVNVVSLVEPTLCFTASNTSPKTVNTTVHLTLEPCSSAEMRDAQLFRYVHNTLSLHHMATNRTVCLPNNRSADRGTVTPYRGAQLIDPASSAAHAACTSLAGGGGNVVYDAEIGALRTFADTWSICLGVCE